MCKMCSVGCAIATDAVRDEARRRAVYASSLGDEPTAAQMAELAGFDDRLAFAQKLLRDARYEALSAEVAADKAARAARSAPARWSKRLPCAAAKPMTQVPTTLVHADRDRVPRPFGRRLPRRTDLDVITGLHAR